MKTYQLIRKASTPTVGDAITTSTTNKVDAEGYLRTFGAGLVGGGSATVKIQASNDNLSWLDLATISLNATTTSEGFAAEVPWVWVRANATAVTTGSVDVVMST